MIRLADALLESGRYSVVIYIYRTIPNFVEIGPLVLEKKIFEAFLPYMDVVAIVVI